MNKLQGTLVGYPFFYGEPREDANLFVANLKMALRVNRIQDPQEQLGLFGVAL